MLRRRHQQGDDPANSGGMGGTQRGGGGEGVHQRGTEEIPHGTVGRAAIVGTVDRVVQEVNPDRLNPNGQD